MSEIQGMETHPGVKDDDLVFKVSEHREVKLAYSGIMRVQLDEGAFMLERAHQTDAGADLRTPMTFTLPPGCQMTIDTGVHVELPHGCAAFVKSKSGLTRDFGILTDGTVDEGYDGSIGVTLFNIGNRAKTFKRGDKIAQLVIERVEYVIFEQVSKVRGGERGDSGFGSTGR